jgi:hypothetical protein
MYLGIKEETETFAVLNDINIPSHLSLYHDV